MKIPDSRTLPLAAALVALTMAPAASAATPVYREIKDWVVACDNTARCEAIGMQEGYPQLILRLVVDAGPSGEPELSLESEAPVAARDLRLDGARFAASSLLQPATGDEGVQRIGQDGAQVRAFLDAVRNGTDLRAGISEGAPSASLAGLSAALLMIDETQGRLGTTTALLRRGPLPAAQVPAAPAAPLPTRAVVAAPLDDAEASRLVARVRLQAADDVRREDCFVEPDTAYDEAHALDDDEALVALECWRGAYQSSSLLFRVRRDGAGAPRRLRLTVPVQDEGAPRVIDAFTNVGFGQGQLSHFAKGRGLADCGESATWAFDGRDFRLQRYHRLGWCRGGNPGDWPTLWRTRGD